MTDVALPTARDWMTKQYLTVRPESDIYEAIEKLLKSGLSAAPVVDDEGRPIGMMTEKDGLRALSQLLYSEQSQRTTVRDHMSPTCGVLEPQMDPFQVTEVFLTCNFPALPVVENNRVVGVVRRQAQLQCMESFRIDVERQRSRMESQAGRQADRPRGIGALQQAAGSTTREQLVRLFGRRSG